MMLILFTIIVMSQEIIDLTFFDFRHRSSLKNYDNNTAYLNFINQNERNNLSDLPDNQITVARIAKMNEYKMYIKDRSLNDIVNYLIRIIIGMIFAIIHFKMYKKSTNNLKHNLSQNTM
ncbi:MAG: hypothetical protein EOP33_02205 [Rickettsiaceae bacterium]|nr:MAG: hypothetical protein EOP33_02205 [Rickettsiaceae bacterium]